jgi:hypothetical protein
MSQAFYAELKGDTDEYDFTLADSLPLYVNLLSPAIPGALKDYSADVSVGTENRWQVLFALDGPSVAWADFWEPFAGDHYWKGPERREKVGPGEYRVRVWNPGNQGKYVLAVGEKERFTPGEIVRMTGMLPGLKKDYFGKSPLTAFFNRSGLFLGGAAVVVAGVVVLGVLAARK